MRVDAAPVRAHVQALIDNGAITGEVAIAAKVDARFVGRLLRDPAEVRKQGGVHSLERDTADRLLAVSSSTPRLVELRRNRTLDKQRRSERRADVARRRIGLPTTRAGRVAKVAELAELHRLPLDRFISHQLQLSLAEVQEMLRDARRDGLIPTTIRARAAR